MPKHQITIPFFIPNIGCPGRCVFCDQQRTTGYRPFPDINILKNRINKQLAYIPESVNRIELAFFGGNFTGINKKKQAELLSGAEIYLNNGTIDAIRLSTRPDFIDDQSLKLLKKYNVSTIELGIQSFDDSVLEASNRGHGAADIYRAVKLIKKSGFDLVIQLMPGLPGDTLDGSIMSANIAAEMKPSGVRIYPVVVIKGTELENLFRSNKYVPMTLNEAVETCSKMHQIFHAKGIPVIRTGLHPVAPDELKNIIAGPYHTSFGFLVKSRLKRNVLEEKIEEFIKSNSYQETSEILITIPDKNREEFIGNKKENIIFIKKKFKIKNIFYNFGDKLLIRKYS